MKSWPFYLCLILSLLGPFAVFGQSTSTIELPDITLKKLKRYLSLELYYTHDYISNTGGVTSGPRNIGAIDLYLESDLSKYSDVQGDFMAHFIHINANDSRGQIGDSQFTSNIDMPSQVDRMGDLWYQHHWSGDFKTLIGIHDLSSEFNVTPVSLQFLNTSFGTTADLIYSGAHGPSVYPLSAVGARALYNISEKLSFRGGFYDADPGDESTYRSLHSDIGGHHGYFSIGELSHDEEGLKIALGGWSHSKAQEKFATEQTGHSHGAYGIFEQKIRTSFWAFARYGWSNPVVNPIQSNIAAGLVYQGIFQRKKVNDEAGIGFTRASFSKGYLNSLEKEESILTVSAETAYETYYQFTPFKQLTLRPDLQYITNPSGSRSIRNAWAMGFRSVIEIN